MIIVTAEQIAGRRVVRTLGLVKGNTVRACHAADDLLAFFKNLAGGELVEYTGVISQAREQALDRMVREAQNLGADAITSLRFTTGYVTHGAAEILAYGTAVVTEAVSPAPDTDNT
jgi:uncharacterized protein YbjQ (UPF0145 family)